MIKIIIDSTITSDEEYKLRERFHCPIVRFDESSYEYFPQEVFTGDRFETIFISKNQTNYPIYNPKYNIWIYPTLIQINSKVWSLNDHQVSAKAKTVDDLINGYIYTLFAEKYAYTNDLIKSYEKSTFMYHKETIFINNFDEEFFMTQKDVNYFTLGRFYGRTNRADNIDFLSSKLELKYSSNSEQQENLAKFIDSCFRYFLGQLKDIVPDYICYVPTKKDKFNRFKYICKDNILLLKKNYKDLKMLTQSERELEVDGAFEIDSQCNVQDKTLLVVDDIVTTGSTTREIAKILYEAGARKVVIFSIAQTFHNNYTGYNVNCGKCNSPVVVRFKNSNSQPIMFCKNQKCGICYDTNQQLFVILDLIYGSGS